MILNSDRKRLALLGKNIWKRCHVKDSGGNVLASGKLSKMNITKTSVNGIGGSVDISNKSRCVLSIRWTDIVTIRQTRNGIEIKTKGGKQK